VPAGRGHFKWAIARALGLRISGVGRAFAEAVAARWRGAWATRRAKVSSDLGRTHRARGPRWDASAEGLLAAAEGHRPWVDLEGSFWPTALPMDALVTGANGFVGRTLVRWLVATGKSVRALVRPGSDLGAWPAGVEVIRGDAMDLKALRRAVDGCALVYHLAGVRRAPDRQTFLTVNAGSTELLLDACLERGAARGRFVLAGSLASLGPSREGRREEDPFAPAEWYGESKAEAERIALSYRDKLPVAIGRPPRILGPGDRENLLFFRLVARGLLVRIPGPERPLSFVDVDDCARGFLMLGERPEAVGEAFFLASAERTSLVGLQEEVARALGVRARPLPVPPGVLWALAFAADGLSRVTGRRLPLNRKLARQILAPGWTCHTDKAERLLGFRATTTLEASVARSARYYREHHWL